MTHKQPPQSECPRAMARRDALRALTAGVALAACGGPSGGRDAASAGDTGDANDAAGNSDATCSPQTLRLGPASNYAAGTWTLNHDDPNNPVIVGNDAGGYFVFTAICPHDFCSVDPPAADGQTVCRCHLSYFDGSGQLIRGPSPRGLDHFAAAICDGMLTADPNVVVSPDTRTRA